MDWLGLAMCRMTLLLGPPGSGKTTLLLALAGKLSKDLKVRHRTNMYRERERERAKSVVGIWSNMNDLENSTAIFRGRSVADMSLDGFFNHRCRVL